MHYKNQATSFHNAKLFIRYFMKCMYQDELLSKIDIKYENAGF